MTGYSNTDLSDGWEFKILRSAMGAFDKPEQMRKAIEEEGRAGWVLLEKFDNQRLRFKRPVSARASDIGNGLGIDPYRTHFGMGQGKMAAIIIAIVFGTIGLVITFVVLKAKQKTGHP